MLIRRLIISLWVFWSAGPASAEPASAENLTRLAESPLAGWEAKSFEGETDYEVVRMDGEPVIRAEANDSASGLFLEKEIDLDRTPILVWRWRVDAGPQGLAENLKSGDDYAARIYLVRSGGAFFWRTKALNYVWSSRDSKGATWPNAFAGDNVQMIAVRSSEDKRETWYEERRNVREDFRKYFGEDIESIDAIAIMTDTDNSGGRALSFYGDIRFLPADAP